MTYKRIKYEQLDNNVISRLSECIKSDKYVKSFELYTLEYSIKTINKYFSDAILQLYISSDKHHIVLLKCPKANESNRNIKILLFNEEDIISLKEIIADVQKEMIIKGYESIQICLMEIYNPNTKDVLNKIGFDKYLIIRSSLKGYNCYVYKYRM